MITINKTFYNEYVNIKTLNVYLKYKLIVICYISGTLLLYLSQDNKIIVEV